MNVNTKQKQTHRHRKQIYNFQSQAGTNEEYGTDRYKHFYIMQIATRILCVAEIPVYHRDLYSMVSLSRLFIVTYLFNLYAKYII